MAIKKEKKVELIDKYKELINNSEAIFFVDSQQVKTEDILGLKEKLSNQRCSYKLIKNTLFSKAWKESKGEELAELIGYNAAVFCDPGSSSLGAKELTAFTNLNKQTKLKTGLMGNYKLNAEDIGKISKLPSKDQLLQQLLYLLNYNITRFATDLNSPLQKLAYLLNQIQNQQEV